MVRMEGDSYSGEDGAWTYCADNVFHNVLKGGETKGLGDAL